VPDLPKLLNFRSYAAAWLNVCPDATSVWRRRTGTDELLEQIDYLRLAADFSIQKRKELTNDDHKML
jgi:hypothetical protein